MKPIEYKIYYLVDNTHYLWPLYKSYITPVMFWCTHPSRKSAFEYVTKFNKLYPQFKIDKFSIKKV